MKYILLPIIRGIVASYTIFLILYWICINMLHLMWDGNTIEWSKLNNNFRSAERLHSRFIKRCDDTPLDTFIRLYNFDFYH